MAAYLLVLLCTVSGLVLGYEEGPPIDSYPNLCQDMIPTGHGYRNVMGPSPYRVTTSGATYSPGATLTVTVEATDGTTEIEGLFVQARRRGQGRDGTKAVGSFADPPTKTQLLKCAGRADSAWAHDGEPEAIAASVTWKAPPCDEGPLAFMATVVKGPKEAYWARILSSEVTFSGTEDGKCNAAPASIIVPGLSVMGVVLALLLAVYKIKSKVPK